MPEPAQRPFGRRAPDRVGVPDCLDWRRNPPGKVAAHFDRIDRKKFKEVCGDTMCFWGNVPSSLLVTGTPQQVKDDVKELVDLFGETGLIIDGPGGIPDQAKPENVEALAEAVEEYAAL